MKFGVPAVARLINLAFEEDLCLGDLTSICTIDAECSALAELVAKESFVVAALPLIEMIAVGFAAQCQVKHKVKEGVTVKPGSVLAEIRGAARELLAMERTLLNFLQRSCGVATFTKEFVTAAAGLTVLDTRKTMPGFRWLDKYAARVGGAKNHRFSLGDMILVKNNHVDLAGGMPACLKALYKKKPLYTAVEVEVRNQKELLQALEFAPQIVMLDNFSDEQIVAAVKLVRRHASPPLVEVSGGVTKARLAHLAQFGVDAVSIGALTTQATNVDISMRVRALSSKSPG